MAIQIMSDLHLEAPRAYERFDITPRAPYLALLGDIGNVFSHWSEYRGFLVKMLMKFSLVLLVPGNHEPYHSDWPSTLRTLSDFEDEVESLNSLGKFVLLDRVAHHLPREKTVILGCSLFSWISPANEPFVRRRLHDFTQIGDWDPPAHTDAHVRDLVWLNLKVAELEQTDNKIIILTHWSPRRLCVDNVEPEPATSGFCTDLSEEACFKSPSVRLWAFGHTHNNCDFVVRRGRDVPPLRVLANQRGYHFAQAGGFDAEKTVEL
ncbi:hypothetical protein CDD81_4917 [Ophiocordyceps australis]|uniref:Calcineurin-like phosphoesterase domain-containing protein n=1 Tax=Ophiocordyceps australis TaxID=1399860 RepID=A0A2C5Y9P6_9HYPO|nr:hypothetical protein CDD81_4917 [Ophiocordyceps australis]